MQNAKCKIDIYERTFEFACRIVRLHRAVRGITARPLLNQMLRSGTGIGANLEEAEAGQSKPDFISKTRIALKEARETVYWLRLIAATEIVKPMSRIDPLIQESREITAILTTIVRNASQNPSGKR
jgi:four helix bundle protein